MGFCWDVVAVTAETAGQAHAFQAELQQRRELGSLPGVDTNTILLAVPDPHPTPAAPWETRNTVVGSGGATLNAVLAVAEQLSARQGTGTLDANVLQSRRVCVLHSASTHRVPAASCVGRAFSPLPAALAEADASTPGNGLACNVDLVLLTLQRWVGDAAPGVWVCSTDPFLNLPAGGPAPIAWGSGITAVALPAALGVGTQRGVYKLDAANRQAHTPPQPSPNICASPRLTPCRLQQRGADPPPRLRGRAHRRGRRQHQRWRRADGAGRGADRPLLR